MKLKIWSDRRYRIGLIGLFIGSILLLLAQMNSGAGDFTFEPEIGAATNGAGSVIDLNDGRETQLYLPDIYTEEDSIPLLINLHGYTGTGVSQTQYTFMQEASNKAGIAYMAPNGSKDNLDNNFWNAGDACCNFNAKDVDDITYLNTLIDQALAAANIDSKKVYLFGHSNGSFMSYAFLCSGSARIAAVAGLAGAMDPDSSLCQALPSNVLHIHGDNDETISFQGGALFGNPYTSVKETVSQWREINSCKFVKVADFDLLQSMSGSESEKSDYVCAEGSFELWRIKDGAHTPTLDLNFAIKVINWLQKFSLNEKYLSSATS